MLDRLKFAVAPLFFRAVIGYGFYAHGFAKLARGPEKFAVILGAMGIPLPQVTAWLTTILEMACGIAVLAGAFLPLVAVPMAVILLTAMFGVHLQYGFSSVRLLEVTPEGARFGPVGIEVILLYLGGLVTMALNGPGPWSIDAWRHRRRGRDRPQAIA